jgi:butyryl-CoA dehydrogenase
LAANDVSTIGLFHKIGWKALPSIALEFGENDDCVGWLVGEPNQGLRCMFQMMNGARLAVGMSATATASAAYCLALDYARTRPQGRALGNRDAASPQIPIIAHADVRRMLLAQKAIVEGSLALLLRCGLYADLAQHGTDPAVRARSQKLLDFLTPIAKTVPSEKGFEANALAVQVHGGYGYTSEYLPELYLREQKLNSLHEGTTGIQSLDLLARKIFADGGEGAAVLGEEMRGTIAGANTDPALAPLADALASGLAQGSKVLMTLGGRAAAGELERALSTSAWHLELVGILVIAWQLLEMARVATVKPVDAAFREGKVQAAHYWFEYEMAKVPGLCALLSREQPSYLAMSDSSF